MDEPVKHIDIEEIIKKRSLKLAKWLPRFFIKYLKRIIHEDEMNQMLNNFGHLRNVEFIEEALRYLDISYTIEGLEKLNKDERYLFASNHPLGGLDGIILIHAISKNFDTAKVPANDLLMNVTQLQDCFIPVNKHGSQSRENARITEATYASNMQVFSFPAGLCSRKQKRKIEDLEWKKSFIVKAKNHNRPIVPVFFSGRNSNFFYNLARIRNFLRIKVNIEMLYLVDEMFKQRGQRPHVIIGDPIPHATFDSTKKPIQWAAWVKSKVYQLNKQ